MDDITHYQCIIADLIQELVNLGYDVNDLKLTTSFTKEDEEKFLSVYKESEVNDNDL